MVKLALSDDYGRTFEIHPKLIVGNVGKNVKAGNGRQIIWDFERDFPDGLNGSGFVFAVEAELQKGGSKMPFYLIGAGVAGGAAYFISQSLSNGEEPAPEETKGSVSVTIPGDI